MSNQARSSFGFKRSKSLAGGVNKHHDGNLSIREDWNLRRADHHG
jgi:hypothetical protein